MKGFLKINAPHGSPLLLQMEMFSLCLQMEFRAAITLRYNLTPKGVPSVCNGCNENFDVRHALNCKMEDWLMLVTMNCGILIVTYAGYKNH